MSVQVNPETVIEELDETQITEQVASIANTEPRSPVMQRTPSRASISSVHSTHSKTGPLYKTSASSRSTSHLKSTPIQHRIRYGSQQSLKQNTTDGVLSPLRMGSLSASQLAEEVAQQQQAHHRTRTSSIATEGSTQNSLSVSHSLLQSSPSMASIQTVNMRPPKKGTDEEYQGRVRVAVRVRPYHTTESNNEASLKLDQMNDEITVSDGKRDTRFQFDHIYGMEATNDEVFRDIGVPLVRSALGGFNATLLAYGQTSTGKTHTLSSADGLLPRAVQDMFQRIQKDIVHFYKVTFSYMQVYNERIYDLLASGTATESDLTIREHPEQGVYVEGLTELVVRNPNEVSELLKLGRAKLVFAETKMNRASSRSHALCVLKIERSPNPDCKDVVQEHEESDESNNKESAFMAGQDVLLRGRFILCDLAGSERLKKTQASGQQLTEAQHINGSLLELGNVIHALTESQRQHVPFRNSVLTRYLQESFGGNCKTSLIVCVSPSPNDVSETKGTLAFGHRAMKITNKARINVEIDYKALSEQLQQRLRDQENSWLEKYNALEEQLNALKSDYVQSQEQLHIVKKTAEEYNQQLQANIQETSEQTHSFYLALSRLQEDCQLQQEQLQWTMEVLEDTLMKQIPDAAERLATALLASDEKLLLQSLNIAEDHHENREILDLMKELDTVIPPLSLRRHAQWTSAHHACFSIFNTIHEGDWHLQVRKLNLISLLLSYQWREHLKLNEASVSQLQKERDQLTQSVRDLNQQVLHAVDQNQSLKTEQGTSEQQIKQLQQELSNAQSEIKLLKEKNENNEQDVQHLNNLLRDENQNVEHLNTELSNRILELDQLYVTMESKNQEIVQLNVNLHLKNEEIIHLKQQTVVVAEPKGCLAFMRRKSSRVTPSTL